MSYYYALQSNQLIKALMCGIAQTEHNTYTAQRIP